MSHFTIITEKEYLTNFLSCYKSHRELWDPKHENYMNQHAKLHGYKALLKILRTVFVDATIHDVKKKINALRTGYRREVHKIKMGQATGKKYTTKLWWFKYIDFLQSHMQNVTLVNIMDDSVGSNTYDKSESSSKDESFFENDNEDKKPIQSDNEELDPNNILDEDEMDLNYEPHTKRLKILYRNPEIPKVEDSLDVYEENNTQHIPASSHMTANVSHIPPPHVKPTKITFRGFKSSYEEDEVLACGWMMQYSSLRNDQKIFVKKAIDDILFEAKLETLHRHSMSINESALCNSCHCVAEQFSMTN